MVKVERSMPAPESLETESKKANGSYCESDVVERLKADFHDKCYICGLNRLQDPEIDHLLPHKNGKYPDRKFDWNNLFWCCRHCNSVKNKRKYDEGIIDCCQKDPEKVLCFSLREDDVCVQVCAGRDKDAILTAELINETFNLRNTGIREAACDNRFNSLLEAMDILFRELDRYSAKPKLPRNIRVIESLLRREAAFAAFRRGYVRSRLSVYPDLAEYVM